MNLFFTANTDNMLKRVVFLFKVDFFLLGILFWIFINGFPQNFSGDFHIMPNFVID